MTPPPINTDLIDTYDDLAPFLVEQANNSLDGTVYGVPHGWGANVLQYNTEVVDPAPTSWGAVFDPDSPYAGKIAAYDGPIYIADAALYLMATQPDLGITNPYALDQGQFDDAIDLLKEQSGILSEYWSDYVAYEDNFRSGSTVLGTSWQIITNTLQADDPPTPVDAVLPEEGSTAWSDNWMIYSETEHPNCAYEWINYITSPRGAGHGGLDLRRGAGQPGRVQRDDRRRRHGRALRAVPRRRRRRTTSSSGTGPRRPRSASTGAPTSSAWTTPSGWRPGPR